MHLVCMQGQRLVPRVFPVCYPPYFSEAESYNKVTSSPLGLTSQP